MKRCFAMILMLCCLLTLIPTTVTATSAQEEKVQGGKLIALTFDDGPGYYTNQLLDGLAERNVKVTFFSLGQCIGSHPDTLRRAFNEGHEIAQHTYNHPMLTGQSDSQIQWQIRHTDELLDQCLGYDLNYNMRPPYGDVNSRVLSLIGCPAIIWSVDSRDWESRNSYSVRDKIVSEAFDGAIVLAHDIHKTTTNGVLWAIDILKDRGYEFVTVSELYRRRGVAMENGTKYYYCKPNGTDLGPISQPVITAEPLYGGIRVTMEADPGAKIYYSLDGAAPYTLYEGEILLQNGAQIKAFAAYALNKGRSETTVATLSATPLKPLRVYAQDGSFLVDNPNENVDVRFTTDGTDPTTASLLYEDGIPWYDGVFTVRPIGYGVIGDPTKYYTSSKGNLYLDVLWGEWYFADVDWAVSEGLLKGTGEYLYEPGGALSRAMFVTLLHRFMQQRDFDVTTTTQAGYSDVANGSWYSEAVNWASEQGLVLGYEDNSFRPDVTINREEMCVILDRLLTLLEQEPAETEIRFSDEGRISSWAYEAVCRLVSSGIIRGNSDNTFNPQGTATRAEAATVLRRMDTNLSPVEE